MANTILANAITTLADTKEYLGVTVTTDDNLLTGLINAATGVLEAFTGRKMKWSPTTTPVQGVYTDTTTPEHSLLDGNGTTSLWLDEYPVQSIDLLKIRDTTYSTWVTINSGDYVTDKDIGRLQLASAVLPVTGIFPNWAQSVTVNYKAGYDYDGGLMPWDLKLFCWRYVGFQYFDRRRSPMINYEGVPAYFVSQRALNIDKDYGIPSEVLALLMPYRKLVSRHRVTPYATMIRPGGGQFNQ